MRSARWRREGLLGAPVADEFSDPPALATGAPDAAAAVVALLRPDSSASNTSAARTAVLLAARLSSAKRRRRSPCSRAFSNSASLCACCAADRGRAFGTAGSWTRARSALGAPDLAPGRGTGDLASGGTGVDSATVAERPLSPLRVRSDAAVVGGFACCSARTVAAAPAAARAVPAEFAGPRATAASPPAAAPRRRPEACNLASAGAGVVEMGGAVRCRASGGLCMPLGPGLVDCGAMAGRGR
mmetsp:Transcript_14096/g.42681  ORF Transcript_14096/g.42681 Transcript_14096/m.42681 type:complete len:243 (+) Transcript_14096:995-1723(+)